MTKSRSRFQPLKRGGRKVWVKHYDGPCRAATCRAARRRRARGIPQAHILRAERKRLGETRREQARRWNEERRG